MKRTELIAEYTRKSIDLENFMLGNEFFYQSLPLCVIDSIFSIGVRYEGVKNVVIRFCEHVKIQVYREKRDSLPETINQYGVNDFLNDFSNSSGKFLAENIFKNRQRTSTRNGILKAEAVVLFLSELRYEKVNYFQDLPKISEDFEKRIRLIAGQKSGISLQYFFMLAGSDDLIKPDRMVIRYLEGITNEKISIKTAQELLSETSRFLLEKHGLKISPRFLDNAIWNYQRNIK